MKTPQCASVMISMIVGLFGSWSGLGQAEEGVGATHSLTSGAVPNPPRLPVEADVDRLPSNERAALADIVAAARVIDAVAMRYPREVLSIRGNRAGYPSYSHPG